MYLTVCPPYGPGSIPSRGGEFQRIFARLITHTWRGDGRRQVVTSRLEGYEEYEAIQLLPPSGPPTIKMAMGQKMMAFQLSPLRSLDHMLPDCEWVRKLPGL